MPNDNEPIEILPVGYYSNVPPVIHDWGEVISFSPDTYFTPISLQELTDHLTLLLKTGTGGRKLRFLGGQHSCSEIFEGDIVINTSKLPLAFDVSAGPDGKKNIVTASAWMHCHEFLYRAAKCGLSMTASGGTDAQTMAGLISTNTAGATVHTDVYETLRWVEYLAISPDGQSLVTKRVNRGDADFTAVMCSLGSIGFITEVGFELVPQLFFEGGFRVAQLDDILGDVAKTCDTYDFWRIEWVPTMDWGLLWFANQIEGKGEPVQSWPPNKDEEALAAFFKQDEAVSGAFMDDKLQAIYAGMKTTFKPTTISGPMRNVIPVDRFAPLRVAMAEWSFDPADLPKLRQVCQTYFEANKWPNLATEIECTKTDGNLMSPWNWPELPYIIKFNFQYLTDFLTADQKLDIFTHLEGLWDAIDAAGIPFKAHWGKINFLTPERVKRDYGLDAFMPHVHPFWTNDYIAQRLGLGGAS